MISSASPFGRRQVHLDFHNSAFIPDVGSEFDPTAFARTMKQARVDSVTAFAKCHHGMCYYPTRVGAAHPALAGRDLLGEQIEALHRHDIRCPIYTTVGWEEDAAARHPDWRQLTREGLFVELPALPNPLHPGKWKCLNFLHPDYQDYMEAHVRELCERYEVDGIFFDIVFFGSGSCWSEPCRRFRREHGLLEDDDATFERFNAAAQASFAAKFSRMVRGLAPRASIFYNAGNDPNGEVAAGPRMRAEHMTHLEIESLPSGFWGYYHFPRVARHLGRWGRPWLGMTGRFQRMWGDFGGLKPQAALEYECFRTQAMGGACSVGDQLGPRGDLDPGAYRLIGAVYTQIQAAEDFYDGAQPIPQVGILTASYPGQPGGLSEEGAAQMTEEAHYDALVGDALIDLAGLDVLVLPDTTVIVEELRDKLRAYYQAGGRLIVSFRGGLDAAGRWALDFLPLSVGDLVESAPTYWRARQEFLPQLALSDRVVYEPGLTLQAGQDVDIWAERALPYFPRTDATFSSHFQTPPVAETTGGPVIVAGERFVYFADPIFREYRRTGNLAVRDAWREAMRYLIGPPAVGDGLPTTVQVYPLRRDRDLLLTLLHYVPVRKALDIDMIEERHALTGEVLRLARPCSIARVWRGPELTAEPDGRFILPPAKGRLLLEVPDYFP